MLYFLFFFFSSRRRHTRWNCDWSSDVCSSDLESRPARLRVVAALAFPRLPRTAPVPELPLAALHLGSTCPRAHVLLSRVCAGVERRFPPQVHCPDLQERPRHSAQLPQPLRLPVRRPVLA